jgi:hypothetical protein
LHGFGIVVLDSSCYGPLSHTLEQERFRSNLRASGWIAQPTELNLIEVAATENVAIRRRLLEVVREISGSEPMLAWPLRLLREVSRSMLRGETHYTPPASGREHYLYNEAAIDALVTETRNFSERIESAYNELHARHRKHFQAFYKSIGKPEYHSSIPTLLDQEWSASDWRVDHARATWGAIGLPGDAPMDLVDRNEVWQIFLEAEGAAVYERTIASEMPARVGRLDLLQLVYLPFAKKRMIVSADKPLLRAAGAILHGRYSNARAVNVKDLVR